MTLRSRSPRREHTFDHWHFLTRTFLYVVKRAHWRVLRELREYVTGVVIDVGAGNAPYRDLFDRADTYILLDLDPVRRPAVIADANALPFPDSIADSVVCCEVLEHVPQPSEVVSELRRIVRPGGLALVTTPMSWGLHYEPHDYWRFTKYGLRVLLESQGFTIVDERRIGGLFSLIGSRLVEGIALTLWRRLAFLPRRLRHALLLVFCIPMSLVFDLLGIFFDPMIPTDAIGWAAIARRIEGVDE